MSCIQFQIVNSLKMNFLIKLVIVFYIGAAQVWLFVLFQHKLMYCSGTNMHCMWSFRIYPLAFSLVPLLLIKVSSLRPGFRNWYLPNVILGGVLLSLDLILFPLVQLFI